MATKPLMIYTKRDMKGGFKNTTNTLGFTIIEVMIFLAISGITFLIAATFINGKETQAEYYQGMNQVVANIRTIINDVSYGNYPLPYNGSLNCSVGTGGLVIHSSSTSSSSSSVGCTLIGEALAPQVGSQLGHYTLFTIAGCQFYDQSLSSCSNSINNNPITIQQEQPQVLGSLTKSAVWPGGVEVTRMYNVVSGQWTQIGLVAFLSSLPTHNGNIYQSGSQPVSIVAIPQSILGNSNTQYEQQINSSGSYPDNSGINVGYIVMCFQGGNGNDASITVGASNGGQQLSSSLDMGKEVPPLCR